MTTNLPGLGPDNLVPVINRELDPAAAGLGAEEYFVLTRIDGRTTLRQLIHISGFPEARTLAILTRLHDVSALLLPGETPRKAPPEPPPSFAPPSTPTSSPSAASSASAATVAAARAAVEKSATPPMGIFLDELLDTETVDLTDAQRRAIREKHQLLRDADLFTVLGVGREADRRDLKNAYRTLSKTFHPDRFFGRSLGSYKQMLAEIFDIASSALEVLTDPERREIYVNALNGTMPAPRPGAVAPPGPPGRAAPPSETAPRVATPPTGTPVLRRRAAELYETACNLQVSGDYEQALASFAAAIAIDPQPRTLRRAAECALQAQELRLAEEYAKKGTELDPNHASAHRIQAKVLQASGRRNEARQALERASRLEPDNPHIAAELRDLAE